MLFSMYNNVECCDNFTGGTSNQLSYLKSYCNNPTQPKKKSTVLWYNVKMAVQSTPLLHTPPNQ